MMVKLYNVLSTAELQWIREFIAEAPFQDGKLSAGTLARDIKDNQELSLGGAENVEQLLRLYMTAYGRHRGFHNAALPQRVSDPIFARYDGGQTYGDHVDDAIMGGRGAPRFRCDVATTLFLSDPETYEGGELTVTTPFGRQTVKMKAGDAVVYPASSLHQVAPVTSGTRVVAVAWIQSMVRSAERRELLRELDEARTTLIDTEADREAVEQINHSYENLMRMWAEV